MGLEVVPEELKVKAVPLQLEPHSNNIRSPATKKGNLSTFDNVFQACDVEVPELMSLPELLT